MNVRLRLILNQANGENEHFGSLWVHCNCLVLNASQFVSITHITHTPWWIFPNPNSPAMLISRGIQSRESLLSCTISTMTENSRQTVLRSFIKWPLSSSAINKSLNHFIKNFILRSLSERSLMLIHIAAIRPLSLLRSAHFRMHIFRMCRKCSSYAQAARTIVCVNGLASASPTTANDL